MIRSTLKRGLKKVLGREKPPPARPASPSAPVYAAAAAPHEDPVSAEDVAPVEAAPVEAAAEEVAVEEAPAAEASVEAAAEAEAAVAESGGPEAASADDTVGPPILFEEVQEILDEMVRPALQMDGGDISLLKIEGFDIHVKLQGACSTCPSSIMTMKMGVEALLREEFPQMKDLIQIDG